MPVAESITSSPQRQHLGRIAGFQPSVNPTSEPCVEGKNGSLESRAAVPAKGRTPGDKVVEKAGAEPVAAASAHTASAKTIVPEPEQPSALRAAAKVLPAKPVPTPAAEAVLPSLGLGLRGNRRRGWANWRYYRPLRHPMSAQPLPRGRLVGQNCRQRRYPKARSLLPRRINGHPKSYR